MNERSSYEFKDEWILLHGLGQTKVKLSVTVRDYVEHKW